jgi:hypothetical protein
VAESFADGLAPEADFAAARAAALTEFSAHFGTMWVSCCAEAAMMATAPDIRAKMTRHFRHAQDGGFSDAAHYAAEAASGYAADGPHAEGIPKFVVESTREAVQTAERQHHARVLHCIFGNPLRPLRSLPPATFAWNGDMVRRIAQSVYIDRAFDRLPILADALEEAGCNDAAILDHCRDPGPHARGCWVVDLILSKDR